MATLSMTEYGGHASRSAHGEKLVGRNGDGDTAGETHVLMSEGVEERLVDIMVMENVIAMSPQEGDKDVLDILAFERIALENGFAQIDPSVVDTYPDLPSFVEEIIEESPVVAQKFTEYFGGHKMAIRHFATAPLEFMRDLEDQEARDVLGILLANTIRPQQETRTATVQNFDLAV